MGYPQVYDAEITQSFYAIKEALPEGPQRESLFRDFIRHQNVHTFPNMHSFQENKSILQGSYDLEQMSSEILAVEDVSLPYDYYLEELEVPPFFSPETRAYLQKIYELKKISTGHAAVKVSYRLKTKLALCQKEPAALTTLNLPQPVDPWLTYFQVRPEARVERILPFFEKVKVNPCTTRPLIDPENKQAFWGMWYFWSPFQKNSPSEAEFDCSKIYLKDVHWKSAEVVLKPSTLPNLTPETQRLRSKDKLKMSFVFSAFKARAFRKLEGELKAKVEATYKKILSKVDFAEARKVLGENFVGQDESLTMIGVFLFNLSHNSILKKSQIEIDGYNLKVTLDGILKVSAKPFSMTIFLSTNKPEHASYEPFNNEVARSLIEDDVVVVTTHSVFGEALSLALKTAREKAASSTRPKYQFVALLSCLAKSYFPTGALPPPQKGQKIDYISSLTTLTELRGIGALTMIGMVDHSIRFGQSPPFESWLKSSKYNNFLTYETVTGQ